MAILFKERERRGVNAGKKLPGLMLQHRVFGGSGYACRADVNPGEVDGVWPVTEGGQPSLREPGDRNLGPKLAV